MAASRCTWNSQEGGEFGDMRRREELLIQLQQAEKQLALSAKAIRGQDMMIRWLEFDGHLDIAETARRVRQAFVKAHAAHVARHYQLLIDLVCLNATVDQEGHPPPRHPKRR